MEKNYGTTSTTTNNFKKRSYYLGVYALGTPQSSFINAYKKDMKITLRELEILLEEEIEELVLRRLHRKIDSKYQACIKDWSKSLYCWIPNYGFDYEFIDIDSLLENLESMLYKLSSYSMRFNNI